MDSQALWVVLHRSLAHKMDYHLSLSYPSDIMPIAEHLDAVFWSLLERAAGQQIPRLGMGLGYWEGVQGMLGPPPKGS